MNTPQIPALAVIACNGTVFSIEYLKYENVTASKSGCSDDMFKECPAELPLIDFRSAQPAKVYQFICKDDGPQEIKYYGKGTISEYIDRVKVTGATVTTVGDYLQTKISN